MTETADLAAALPEAVEAPLAAPQPAPAAFDLAAIEDADLRGWAENKAFPDLKTALESQRNLERLLGADKVPLPKDETDAEGWERVAKALGRPDDPAGYGLKGPDGADPGFAGEAGRWFHAAGLNKRQADSLAAAYAAFGQEAAARDEAAFQAQSQAEMQGLQTEWGPLADQRGEEARRGLRLLGWDEATSIRFERAMGTKAMLTSLARIGAAIGEDSFVIGDAPRGFGLSPAAAGARIKTLQADRDWARRYIAGDAEARAEMERLNRVVAEG